MKKLFYLFTVLVIGFALTACKDTDTPDPKCTDDQTLVDGKCVAKEPEPEVCPDGVITIKYANWNLGTEEDNNLERRMIAEFNAQDPCRQVVIDESIDNADWAGSLNAATAAGTLPDVFMLQNIPDAIANEWVLDITQYVENDEDWDGLATNLINSTKYNDGMYGIPMAMFVSGLWINNDLFRQHNVYAPEMGHTWEEFENAVSAMSKPLEGVIGLGEEVNIPDWYTITVSDNLGWHSFDGEKYNLNSSEYIEGVNKAKSFYDNGYVYDALTPEVKNEYFDNIGWWGEAFDKGHAAIKFDASYNLNGFIDNYTFDWDFIGLPGGKVVMIPDYVGVSAATEHPEVAVEFAKWMSFSKDGYLKRLEISNANEGISINTLPLIDDKEVVDGYFETVDVRGLRQVYENLDEATIVEGVKVNPGYTQSRWTAPTGITIGTEGDPDYRENASIGDMIWLTMRGNVNYSDYADAINTIANAKYNEALEALTK